MTHFHNCPHCFEAFSCDDGCTICPDLEDRGRDFGSHHICHDVICHIDRAIKKYTEGYERRQQEALRRLQAPAQNVGTELNAKFMIDGLLRRPIA